MTVSNAESPGFLFWYKAGSVRTRFRVGVERGGPWPARGGRGRAARRLQQRRAVARYRRRARDTLRHQI